MNYEEKLNTEGKREEKGGEIGTDCKLRLTMDGKMHNVMGENEYGGKEEE